MALPCKFFKDKVSLTIASSNDEGYWERWGKDKLHPKEKTWKDYHLYIMYEFHELFVL